MPKFTTIWPSDLNADFFRQHGVELQEITDACYSWLTLPGDAQVGTVPSWRGNDLLAIKFHDGAMIVYDRDSDDIYIIHHDPEPDDLEIYYSRFSPIRSK